MSYDESGLIVTGTYPVEMELRAITSLGFGPGDSTFEIINVECDAIFTLVKVPVEQRWAWKIEKWEDFGIEGKSTEPKSVGEIKSLYH